MLPILNQHTFQIYIFVFQIVGHSINVITIYVHATQKIVFFFFIFTINESISKDRHKRNGLFYFILTKHRYSLISLLPIQKHMMDYTAFTLNNTPRRYRRLHQNPTYLNLDIILITQIRSLFSWDSPSDHWLMIIAIRSLTFLQYLHQWK